MIAPADLAQGQLDAYNTQDLERFCAFYAADVVVADFNGAVTTQGIDGYRARYAKLFAEFPQNRVVLLPALAPEDPLSSRRVTSARPRCRTTPRRRQASGPGG